MELLLLTRGPEVEGVVPALSLLSHKVRIVTPTIGAVLNAGPYDVVMVDARTDLAGALGLCRLLSSTASAVPLMAIVTEAGLGAVSRDWTVTDIVLAHASPAEIDARLRLLPSRAAGVGVGAADEGLLLGELMIDEANYTARLGGRVLGLTYTEFELLTYLARHPGRVFTREQLLRQVWGDDFHGDIRTVDVHIRRLRSKLGCDNELIGTVRNVGYKLIAPPTPRRARSAPTSQSWAEGDPSRAPTCRQGSRQQVWPGLADAELSLGNLGEVRAN
jgi:DNA-binding response OmpR family regulator